MRKIILFISLFLSIACRAQYIPMPIGNGRAPLTGIYFDPSFIRTLSIFLSNGNLTGTVAQNNFCSLRSTTSHTSPAQVYFEMTCTANISNSVFLGIQDASTTSSQFTGFVAGGYGVRLGTTSYRTANVDHNVFSGTFNVGDVIGFDCDFSGLVIYVYINNVSVGNFSISSGTYFAAGGSDGQTGDSWTANFCTIACTYSSPHSYSNW